MCDLKEQLEALEAKCERGLVRVQLDGGMHFWHLNKRGIKVNGVVFLGNQEYLHWLLHETGLADDQCVWGFLVSGDNWIVSNLEGVPVKVLKDRGY